MENLNLWLETQFDKSCVFFFDSRRGAGLEQLNPRLAVEHGAREGHGTSNPIDDGWWMMVDREDVWRYWIRWHLDGSLSFGSIAEHRCVGYPAALVPGCWSRPNGSQNSVEKRPLNNSKSSIPGQHHGKMITPWPGGNSPKPPRFRLFAMMTSVKSRCFFSIYQMFFGHIKSHQVKWNWLCLMSILVPFYSYQL